MRNYVFVEIIAARRDKDEISILFLDGHGSRINPQLWLDALGMHIFIQFLVAHSSTETQMLDLGFNADWKKALKEFLFVPEEPTAHGYRVGLDAF
jgi:hypothetical protein